MISSSPSQSQAHSSCRYYRLPVHELLPLDYLCVFQWFGMDHFLTDTLLCKARQGEPTSYYLADSERQDYHCRWRDRCDNNMAVTVWWWVSWRFTNRPPSFLSSHEEPQRIRDGVMGTKEMAVVWYHDTGVDDWAISQAYYKVNGCIPKVCYHYLLSIWTKYRSYLTLVYILTMETHHQPNYSSYLPCEHSQSQRLWAAVVSSWVHFRSLSPWFPPLRIAAWLLPPHWWHQVVVWTGGCGQRCLYGEWIGDTYCTDSFRSAHINLTPCFIFVF